MNEIPIKYRTKQKSLCQACEHIQNQDSRIVCCCDEVLGYICTREKGHSGNHIACGNSIHGIVWGDRR